MTRYKCPNCGNWVRPLYYRDYNERKKSGVFRWSEYGICNEHGVVIPEMRTKLNECEKIAREWLSQKYGRVERITQAGMPDFLAGGLYFEVKRKYGNNTLHFTKKQMEMFRDLDPNIIVVSDGEIENNIRFSDVPRLYNIYEADDSMQVKLNDRLVVPLKGMVDGIEYVNVAQIVNKAVAEYVQRREQSNKSKQSTEDPDLERRIEEKRRYIHEARKRKPKDPLDKIKPTRW